MSTPTKIAVVVCLVAAAFVAGRLVRGPAGTSASVASSESTRKVLYWMCPMHPQYKSDHPGDAPCCGMRLEPVYADSQPSPAGRALPDGAVEVGSAQRQLIGVRTDEVTRAPASHLLRVSGRITVDEARLYRLVASVDGWMRELGENSAGTLVKQNQVLASYYAPGFLGAQQSLLYSLRIAEPLQRAEVMMAAQIPPTALNLQTAMDSLRSLGMSELQLEEFRKTKTFSPEIHVYAPITGFVISRNISPGQRFEKGTELYRIADLSHVWVMTDIFEKDREFLRPGAPATVRYQGREFPARMGDVLPQLDPQSRTLRTRFELENPGHILRPDAFVDVELHVTMPASVTVPADAVIDSGLRRTVFVERGGGVFEPRVVETGWRLGDRVEITKGLEPGEHIVVAGNFLIDSESRMKLAAVPPARAAGNAKVEKDPVCGMDVDAAAPSALHAEHGGKTYYFCGEYCLRKFQADPGPYVGEKQPATQTTPRRGPA
jgi:membrane fusion protein, copper/silver efflux system